MTPTKAITLLLLLLAPLTTLGADARRLADLNPGRPGSYPTNFATFAGQLFFSAYTLDTGYELWKLDGTNISLVADINPTRDDLGGVFEGNDSNPRGFRSFAGELYFSAYEPMYGAELWKYTGSNVVRVSDINVDLEPNPTNASPQSSWPRELTVFRDALYFSATSATNPPNYELWRYDTNGISLAVDLHADVGFDYSSYPKGLRVFNDALYFTADDGTNGWELVRYTPEETRVLDINPGLNSSYPKYLTPFGSDLVFQAYTESNGFELWSTDGTNVNLVADLVADAGSSYPEFLTVLNGAVYFRASTPAVGFELHKYDGTNVNVAANINTSGDSFPKNLIRYRNAIVFTADDGIHGWELWRHDGTNTAMVADLNTSGSSYPEDLTISDGILYFTAETPQRGYELWKYDGTNVTVAANLNSGKSSSFPRSLTPLGNKLYFSAADDGRSNWEPWVFDPGFTNERPMVTLTAPLEGAILQSTNLITLSATASDEFEVIGVEFLANGVSLGALYSRPWLVTTNLALGTNVLTAVATDSSGATTTSAPISVFVEEPPVEPATISSVTRSGTATTITAQAPGAFQYILEASTNLTNWTTVDTQSAIEGIVTFSHESAEEFQFYRVRTL